MKLLYMERGKNRRKNCFHVFFEQFTCITLIRMHFFKHNFILTSKFLSFFRQRSVFFLFLFLYLLILFSMSLI